jgi:hypothetical protein
LRLTTRKFWIPGEDAPDPDVPDAYTIAREALAAFRHELSRVDYGRQLAGVPGRASAVDPA